MVTTLFTAALLLSAPPALHVEGPNLKDPQGNVVTLRGCNLGNWMVIEHWMWGQEQPANSSHDQYELENILTKRFGEAKKDDLMDLYRSSWITDRDLKIIKTFRFNCVRLPLNYRLFEDDANPYHLKPNAWKWTDQAVKMCAENGIYVILDMHGVQGGQSNADHTGRQNQNQIWTNEDDQNRLAWLWSKVAEHYRSNSTVAAYDVINEPYGAPIPKIRPVWEKSYQAIRKVDADKLVYAMGHYSGFDMYGDPQANGWHNVGIEMHYYPGLFGAGSPTVATQARHLAWIKSVVAPQAKKLNVPFYIGEMNVVFDAAGGASMMRRTYDLYESLGWSTTMWSYKTLSKEGGIGDATWAMVTNKDPMPKIDFATDSLATIESFFKSGATMPYAVNEKLREALFPQHLDLPPLPVQATRTSAPQGSLFGWTASEVGSPLAGGLESTGETFSLYGGGNDIWGDHDQFRFLQRSASGDFSLTVTVKSLEDLGSYCKAGLMVRQSLDPNSKLLMVTTFPSGEVQAGVRTTAGGEIQGTGAVKVGFPMQMKISRTGGQWTCSFRKVGTSAWTSQALPADPGLTDPVLVGPIALSHDNSQLVKATYSDLTIRLGQG